MGDLERGAGVILYPTMDNDNSDITGWSDSSGSQSSFSSEPRKTKRRKRVRYKVNTDTSCPQSGHGGYRHGTSIKHPVKRLQKLVIRLMNEYQRVIRLIIVSSLFMCYTVYFAFAVRHSVVNNKALIVLTSLVAGYIVYAWLRDHFGETIFRAVCAPIGRWWDRKWHIIQWFVYICVMLAIVLYLAIDVIKDVKQLQSLAGMVFFFLTAWITSKHPKQIKWRPVIWGMTLQFVIGCLVLRWQYGYNAIDFLANEINKFLGYSIEGGAQIFGDPYFIYHPFAMLVVPLVIYIGCVMSILYYWGIIQWVASKIGWLMRVSLHTTAIESVSLTVNVFLSVLDVVIMLKDYMPYLTLSEFHCFLVGAHSTIAGFAFGLFVIFGVSPQHLLTGAVMSAPAAVALAKLNWPETEESRFNEDKDLILPRGTDTNFIDAGIRGAWVAAKSVGVITIQLIAFIGLYSLMDAFLVWIFSLVGVVDLSIASILGYLFIPLAYLMGVDWEDTQEVGKLLGLKVSANEFLSYSELGRLKDRNAISERSAAIVTYAMCGFSSFGSLVIFSGVWQTVDPKRVQLVARQLPRIWMNSNLSCFMTACIASILYSDEVRLDIPPNQIGTLGKWALSFIPKISDIGEQLDEITGM